MGKSQGDCFPLVLSQPLSPQRPHRNSHMTSPVLLRLHVEIFLVHLLFLMFQISTILLNPLTNHCFLICFITFLNYKRVIITLRTTHLRNNSEHSVPQFPEVISNIKHFTQKKKFLENLLEVLNNTKNPVINFDRSEVISKYKPEIH